MIEAVNAIMSLAVLVALICFVYGPWQTTCTDYARQYLFEGRDRLFDLARNGQLDFDSEVYREARADLEAFIRYAHDLTWLRLLITKKFSKVSPAFSDEVRQLPLLIDDIKDQKTQQQVKEIMSDAVFTLVGMMIFKSLILFPLAIVLAIVLLCGHTIKKMVPMTWIRTWTRTIEIGARCERI